MRARKTMIGVGILVSLLMVPYVMAHGTGSGMGMQGQKASNMTMSGTRGYQGMGMMNGRGMMAMGWMSNLNLTRQQKTEMTKLRQKFMMDTLDTRSKIAAKRIELQTLFAQPGVKNTKLKETYKKLLALKTQLMEKRFELRLAMRGVLTPDQLSRASFGRGMGMEMMGRRGGMGQCGRMRMQ